MTTLTRDAAVAALDRKIAELSFADFLTFCRIRSDDPQAPGITPLNPWPFQVERAESWQAGSSEVILKERQLGFSAVLVAPYMLWRAMYHGWSCGYLSVGQQEAREEISRIRALYGELPDFLKVPGTIRVDDASFEGGGRIIAFPSTEHAGISYTLQLAVMDEAAFHPYGAANYAAIQPAVSRGQFIILSTADPSLGPSGFFHDMYFASKRGDTPYAAVFEARRRPDRDEAWYARARSAYAGRGEEFDAYYPISDAAAFVARSGLVFPQFMEARHVKAATLPISSYRRVVAGIDLGGGDPTAIVVCGLDANHAVHVIDAFYRRGAVPVDELGGFLARYPQIDAIECPPEQATVIATLVKTFGLPAHAANNKRADGLNLMASMLENGLLTYEPHLRDLIAEFPGYRWREATDPNDKTRYATKTPVDHHADGIDATRYALMEITAMLTSGVSMPKKNLAGRPFATVAV